MAGYQRAGGLFCNLSKCRIAFPGVFASLRRCCGRQGRAGREGLASERGGLLLILQAACCASGLLPSPLPVRPSLLSGCSASRAAPAAVGAAQGLPGCRAGCGGAGARADRAGLPGMVGEAVAAVSGCAAVGEAVRAAVQVVQVVPGSGEAVPALLPSCCAPRVSACALLLSCSSSSVSAPALLPCFLRPLLRSDSASLVSSILHKIDPGFSPYIICIAQHKRLAFRPDSWYNTIRYRAARAGCRAWFHPLRCCSHSASL